MPDGRMLVCDAERGLLRLASEPGAAIEVLVDSLAGEPLRFCSNAAAASDGSVYFPVSSARYGLHDWRADIVENSSTGGLVRMKPNGETEILLEGLQSLPTSRTSLLRKRELIS